MLRFARPLTAVAAIASASLIVTSTPASAEDSWPGAFPYRGHTATVRAATNTGSAKLDTIPDLQGRQCVSNTCATKTGGSYTCWSGGPSGKTWVAVLTKNGRLGYVAAKCVTFGRFK